MRPLASLALALLVVGCGTGATQTPRNFDVYFPRRALASGPPVSVTATLSGHLVIADGCVYIDDSNERYLIVWPSHYEARATGGLLRVVDETGTILATEGRQVTVDGTEVARTAEEAQDVLLELTGALPPEGCADLVWNASSIVPRQ